MRDNPNKVSAIEASKQALRDLNAKYKAAAERGYVLSSSSFRINHHDIPNAGSYDNRKPPEMFGRTSPLLKGGAFAKTLHQERRSVESETSRPSARGGNNLDAARGSMD
jgi:hypothetical protein